MTNFKPNPIIPGGTPFSPNEVLKGDGFYVSYNERDTDIYGCDTTALVLGQMEHFYILNGDHRARYAQIVHQGLDACLAYFGEHIDEINLRSEQPASPGGSCSP